jgi:sugar lactone lactonase YvrE
MALRNHLALSAIVGSVLALSAACSSSDTGTTSTSATASSSSSSGNGGSGGSSSSTSTSTSTSSGGGAGGGTATPEFVAKLDASKGELAEGLFVDKGTAYVGLAPLGKIQKVDIATGKVSDFGSIPAPPMNGGFLLGIVVDATGNAYVGFGGSPGMPVKNGIYKIPAGGGAVAAPFVTDPEMNFPNGLYLDASNDIFVADSGGTIFDLKPNGTLTKWVSDASLVGTDQSCKNAAPFALGANGLARIGNDFYVANTNLGQIVKVPIKGDGSAGTPSIFAGPDCNALGGVDGIAVDSDGTSLLAVINSQAKITKIDSAGKVTDLFVGKPLDNPASISVVGKTAYLTNSAFFDMTTPAPGLLSFPR